MSVETYDFKKGEAKYIVSHVQPKDESEVVVIAKAEYALYHNNEVIEQGELIKNGLELSYLFRAEEIGLYSLCEKVTIGAETFIATARIKVFDGDECGSVGFCL